MRVLYRIMNLWTETQAKNQEFLFQQGLLKQLTSCSRKFLSPKAGKQIIAAALGKFLKANFSGQIDPALFMQTAVLSGAAMFSFEQTACLSTNMICQGLLTLIKLLLRNWWETRNSGSQYGSLIPRFPQNFQEWIFWGIKALGFSVRR